MSPLPSASWHAGDSPLCSLEVEAAHAVDLEWDGIGLRSRVRLRPLLDRGGQGIAADLLEQARRGRRRGHTDVGDAYRNGHAAGIGYRRDGRAVDRALLGDPPEPRFGIREDMWEARGHRAQIEAL